jgi:hypothetical protein
MLFCWVLYQLEMYVPRKGVRPIGKFFLTREKAQQRVDELAKEGKHAAIRDFYPGEVPAALQEMVELRGYDFK